MAPPTIRHGTPYAYSKQGCRCDECREANTIRCAALQAARTSRTLEPDDPRHGTRNAYSNFACRCGPCTKANTAYRAELRAVYA